MRKWIIVPLFFVLFTISFSAGAEQNWLGYRNSRWASDIFGTWAGKSSELSEDAPEGVNLPEFTADTPLFVKWEPEFSAIPIWIAVDKRHNQSSYDKVFVDTDCDGQLSDEEAVIAFNITPYNVRFGPVKIVTETDDGYLTYHVNLRAYIYNNNKRIYIQPACWYEGNILAEDKQVKIRLIDRNANGRFDDKSMDPYSTDFVQLIYPDKRETSWVGKYLKVGGKLYNLNIAGDGAWVSLEPAENVVYGKLEVDGKIGRFSAGGENGLFRIEPENGKAELPEGTYAIQGWNITKETENGDIWELRAGRISGEKGKFTVKNGNFVPLKLGTSIASEINSQYSSGQYNFSHSITDAVNSNITIYRNSERAEAPELLITNKEGTYKRTYAFEYG